MSRTAGSYMLQPTKDEIRGWLRDTRAELKSERFLRRKAETQLGTAHEVLGQMVLDGKIAIPSRLLGRLVIKMAEQRAAERQSLLVE